MKLAVIIVAVILLIAFTALVVWATDSDDLQGP